MDKLKELRQERLERTETSLKLAGYDKCGACNYWVDKEYIVNCICNLCKDKGVK